MKVITREEANERGLGWCTLTTDNEGPYLDTGFLVSPDGDPYVILHVPLVEAMGAAVGMKTGEEYAELEKEIEDLRSMVVEYGEQVDDFRKLADAYETIGAAA